MPHSFPKKVSNTSTEVNGVITTNIVDSSKDLQTAGETINDDVILSGGGYTSRTDASLKASSEFANVDLSPRGADHASKNPKKTDCPKDVVDILSTGDDASDDLKITDDSSKAATESADDDAILADDVGEASDVLILNAADAISTTTTISAEDEVTILADVGDISKSVSPKTVDNTIKDIPKVIQNGDSVNENNGGQNATAKSKDPVDMDVDPILPIEETQPPSKLVDNLNILLSDDEDDQSKQESIAKSPKTSTTQKGDDEVLLLSDEKTDVVMVNGSIDTADQISGHSSTAPVAEKRHDENVFESSVSSIIDVDKSKEKPISDEPLIPLPYIRSFRDKIAHMTRDDMEEFVLQKIIEGIAEKSELSDMKSNMKTLQNTAEEWRKKALLLTKQCRDLQVVLKNVQEEQAKRKNEIVVPLKITRSVGLQVLMAGAGTRPRPINLSAAQANRPIVPNNPPAQPFSGRRQNTPRAAPIPVQTRPGPKSAVQKQKSMQSNQQTPKKMATPTNMNIKQSPAEKRPIQSIDLTDEEPPAKTQVMSSPSRTATPVSNSVTRSIAPAYPNGNSNYSKAVHMQSSPSPAGSVVFKSSQFGMGTPSSIVRQRLPAPAGVSKAGQSPMAVNQIRMPMRPNLISYGLSAPPLPFTEKQRSNPLWKKLPPKLELTISKSQAGIVISWKLDMVLNESFEEIASYQIYAYQEVSDQQKCWKKIGDVTALPLPMACTLTKFTTGYRYFFAVRGVDVKSRLGPFSEPGSILLISHSITKKNV